MNPLPLLLGFMLIKGLGKKDKDSGDGGLGSLLGNPDAMAMLPHVTKLFDSAATVQEKNDAVMALMTNPAVFDIVSRFAAKAAKTTTTTRPPTKPQKMPVKPENANTPTKAESFSARWKKSPAPKYQANFINFTTTGTSKSKTRKIKSGLRRF